MSVVVISWEKEGAFLASVGRKPGKLLTFHRTPDSPQPNASSGGLALSCPPLPAPSELRVEKYCAQPSSGELSCPHIHLLGLPYQSPTDPVA